jgi:hypothetical protein
MGIVADTSHAVLRAVHAETLDYADTYVEDLRGA